MPCILHGRQTSLGRFVRFFLGIPTREVRFTRRGFHLGHPGARRRLEGVGESFLDGYHAALEEGTSAALLQRLDERSPFFRGFAYEGAAMALSLLDGVLPGTRFRRLLAMAPRHVYMLHVGAGWAMARLRRFSIHRLDPTLRWLAVDGMGFHQGYFHAERYIHRRASDRLIEANSMKWSYAARAFDQGLGRSLWFVAGADPARVRGAIAAFPSARQADLWSGVGLASSYAGGCDEAGLRSVYAYAGPYRKHMAQGAAFAAEARHRAGNVVDDTDAACRLFCHMSAEAASEVVRAARIGQPERPDDESYEGWRARIRASMEEAHDYV